ncbi:hypothetical protein BDC45DRAFT_108968 [Circinella umbellata]|nr:hypothetical protein BDC45DRAFT_108968 [Circinella umbellata]
MLIWVSLITSWAIGENQQNEKLQHEPYEQHCEKKTIMISAKPSPITKTTNVHVGAEREPDQEESDSSNHKFIDEKPTAKIALSVELAKQQQHYHHRWPGVRAESIISKSSVESLHRLMQTQQHQGDETSIYQQQQWNCSAKALPDTFSTRVSANGSVALSDSDSVGGAGNNNIMEDQQPQQQQELQLQSPAMTRLIKQHRQAIIISETASLNSSSVMIKSGASMIDQHRILDTVIAARGREPCDQQQSFANDENVSIVETTATDASSTTAPPTISSATAATKAPTIASSSSAPKNNPVLPIYKSRFAPLATTQEQQSDSSSALGSIFNSTLSSFGSIFSNPTITEEHPESSLPWTKLLQAKLSSIVSSDAKNHSTNRVTKKIAVVGIHGWFPTKVNFTFFLRKRVSLIYIYADFNSIKFVIDFWGGCWGFE